MVYVKLSTLLIFHEITEVSLCGIIISSITRTDKYNKFKTFQLQVIAQFDIFSFQIIILSSRKSEVGLWGDGEPLAPKVPVSDRWSL